MELLRAVMKKNEYAFEEDINFRVGSKRQKKSKNKDTKPISNYFFFCRECKGLYDIS